MTQIIVTVEKANKNFIWHEHIVSGHHDGYDFDLGVATDGSPFVAIDRASYVVDIMSIVEAMIGAVTSLKETK